MDKSLFAPDAGRAGRLDAALRGELARSIEYLAGLAGGRDPSFDEVLARLRSGPVSPFVFGAYASLVAALSRSERPGPHETLLALAARLPARTPPIIFPGGGVPPALWQQFGVLFDTDRDRPFRVREPDPAAAAASMDEVDAGLALIGRYDPAFHADITATQRVIVLAAPVRGTTQFGAASTFFLWGLSVFNAEARRDLVAMIDLLVHESGHLLLFAVAGGEPLAENGSERHASPLRPDPRPVEGIFHAAFVATRVHCALSRLLGAEGLDADLAAAMERQRATSGTAGRTGLATLNRHAIPTNKGRGVLAALEDYWRHET